MPHMNESQQQTYDQLVLQRTHSQRDDRLQITATRSIRPLCHHRSCVNTCCISDIKELESLHNAKLKYCIPSYTLHFESIMVN